MKIEVKLIGAEEFKKILVHKSDEMDKNIRKNLLKCGFKVEAKAKWYCPVDTGRLRSSISTNWVGSNLPYGAVGNKAKTEDGVTPPAEEKEYFEVKVGTNVKYAKYVEYGTGKMSSLPYLYPALRDNFEYIKKTLGDAMVEPLKK